MQRIFLVLLAVALHAPSPFAMEPECESFLGNHLAFIEASPNEIPLKNGTLPDLKLLKSVAEVERFKTENPNYPWLKELAAIESTFEKGSLIYLSEVGPTLWKEEAFENWVLVIRSGLPTDPELAIDTLMKMARGETVSGLSAFSHERMKNAFLADMAGHRIEHEERILSVNRSAEENLLGVRRLHQPHDEARQAFLDRFLGAVSERPLVDPRSGEPVNLKRVDPENQDAYLWAVKSLNEAKAKVTAQREMRENSPSLRIEFRINRNLDYSALRSIDDLYQITNETTALWISRILIREALMRRKLVVMENGSPNVLGEVTPDDQIFLFAAHPELAPYYKVVPVTDEIRHHFLSADFSFLSLPTLTLNAEGDICKVSIGRENWEDSEIEDVKIHFEVTTANKEGYDCNFVNAPEQKRFRDWFGKKWTSFAALAGLPKNSRPSFRVDSDRSRMTVSIEGATPVRILAFYMYVLSEKSLAPGG